MRETDPRLTWMRANSGTLLLILSTLFFPPSLYLSLFSSSRSCFLCFFFWSDIKVLFSREENWTGIFRNNEAPLFPLVSDTVDRRWGVLDFDRVTSEYRRYCANSFSLFFFSFFRQFYSFRIGEEFFIFTSCGGKKKDISFVFDNLTILFLSFKLIEA